MQVIRCAKMHCVPEEWIVFVSNCYCFGAYQFLHDMPELIHLQCLISAWVDISTDFNIFYCVSLWWRMEQVRIGCEQETVLIASDSLLYPETDWLIGNHSDELTPWIPAIAARWDIHSLHNISFLFYCKTHCGSLQLTVTTLLRLTQHHIDIQEMCGG